MKVMRRSQHTDEQHDRAETTKIGLDSLAPSLKNGDPLNRRNSSNMRAPLLMPSWNAVEAQVQAMQQNRGHNEIVSIAGAKASTDKAIIGPTPGMV